MRRTMNTAPRAHRFTALGSHWFACMCRRERRRKLGLPEDLTEEEKAAEKARAEAEAAEAARKRLPVKPVSRIKRMREILVAMKKSPEVEEVGPGAMLRSDGANVCMP